MKLLYLVVDQSFSVSAVAFIKNLAKSTRSSITLLYIASQKKNLDIGEATLAAAQESFLGFEVEVLLKQGDPVEEIFCELDEKAYSMVVLESRRRRRYLPGKQRQLVNQVLKKAPLPVLLVRHANIKLERILVCTSGHDISLPVIKLGAEIAGAAGLDTKLIYVKGTIPSMYSGMSEMEETLDDVISTDTPLSHHLKESQDIMAEYHIQPDIVISEGVAAEEIIKEANQGDYDLVVMGGSNRGHPLSGILMEDVGQEIIERIKSAVLVVK